MRQQERRLEERTGTNLVFACYRGLDAPLCHSRPLFKSFSMRSNNPGRGVREFVAGLVRDHSSGERQFKICWNSSQARVPRDVMRVIVPCTVIGCRIELQVPSQARQNYSLLRGTCGAVILRRKPVVGFCCGSVPMCNTRLDVRVFRDGFLLRRSK